MEKNVCSVLDLEQRDDGSRMGGVDYLFASAAVVTSLVQVGSVLSLVHIPIWVNAKKEQNTIIHTREWIFIIF